MTPAANLTRCFPPLEREEGKRQRGDTEEIGQSGGQMFRRGRG